MKISKILATVSAVFLMTASVASAELLFEENFESENWKDSWNGSDKAVVDENLPLSGDKSLYWNTNLSISEKTGASAGNYVFEMWFYDTATEEKRNPGGNLFFGAKYNEGGMATVGFKSNTSQGKYIYGHVLKGEDVEIFVSAWVDSYALAEVGDYDENMSFSVEIVFFTRELS